MHPRPTKTFIVAWGALTIAAGLGLATLSVGQDDAAQKADSPDPADRADNPGWQPPSLPDGFPPELVLAGFMEGEKLKVRLWDMVEAYEPREAETADDALPAEEARESQPVWFVRWIGEEVEMEFKLADFRGQDSNRRELAAAKIEERLATRRPVLLTTARDGVDPFYWTLIRPDLWALTLLLPEEDFPPSQFVHDDEVVQPVDPRAPQGPAPRYGVAKVADTGELELWTLTEKETSLSERGPKNAAQAAGDAADDAKPRAADAPPAECEWVFDRLVLDEYRIYEAAGEPLSPEDVARRLDRPTTILISSHGKTVDEYYLQAFKPDVLVAYLRPMVYTTEELSEETEPPPDRPPVQTRAGPRGRAASVVLESAGPAAP